MPATEDPRLGSTVVLSDWPQPAVQINLPDADLAQGIRLKWIDAHHLRLAGYRLEDIDIVANVSEFPAIDIGHSDRLVNDIHSPTGSWVIRCSAKGVKLLDPEGDVVLQQAAPMPVSRSSDCQPYVDWAPDETAAVVKTQMGLYLWSLSDGAWHSISTLDEHTPSAWSPSGNLVALLRDEVMETGYLRQLIFFDRRGLDQSRLELDMKSGEILGMAWPRENVIEVFQWYHRFRFFRLPSGAELLDWSSDPRRASPFHQDPLFSPDRRWLTLDEGEFDGKTYSLVDLDEGTRHILIDDPSVYVAFVGWSAEDGSHLEYVVRLAGADAVPNRNTPLGLLTYSPETRESELLFPNALQVSWNPDRSWALVVYRDEASSPATMNATLWSTETGELLRPWEVGEQVVYEDPAFYRGFVGGQENASLLLPTAWSPGGERVIYSTPAGEVVLEDVVGGRVILDRVSGERWDDVRPHWSPQGDYLAYRLGSEVYLTRLTR